MKIILISAFACGLLASPVMADQLYKWVDSEGHVHFSQTPPPGTAVKAQSVQVQAPQHYDSSDGSPESEEAKKPPEQQRFDAEQARVAQRKADIAARNKDANAQTCADLKAQLLGFEQSGRTYTTDANGKRQFMSDADHAKAEQDLKDRVAKACGG